MTPPLQAPRPSTASDFYPSSNTPDIPLATSHYSQSPIPGSTERLRPPSSGYGMSDGYTPQPAYTQRELSRKPRCRCNMTWIVRLHFFFKLSKEPKQLCFLVTGHSRPYYSHHWHRCRCCVKGQEKCIGGFWIYSLLTQHPGKPQRPKRLHQEPQLASIFLWFGLYTCWFSVARMREFVGYILFYILV